VTAADEVETRVSVFRPNTVRARYWDLTLSCGHSVSRLVRRAPQTEPGLAGQRRRPDLPPPARVRCDACPKEVFGA